MCAKYRKFALYPRVLWECVHAPYIARAGDGQRGLSDRGHCIETKGFPVSSAREWALAFVYKRSFLHINCDWKSVARLAGVLPGAASGDAHRVQSGQRADSRGLGGWRRRGRGSPREWDRGASKRLRSLAGASLEQWRGSRRALRLWRMEDQPRMRKSKMKENRPCPSTPPTT